MLLHTMKHTITPQYETRNPKIDRKYTEERASIKDCEGDYTSLARGIENEE